MAFLAPYGTDLGALEWLQRSLQDKFEYYRRGQLWDPTVRRPFAAHRPLPNPNLDNTNDVARAAGLQATRDARAAGGAQRLRIRPRGLGAFRGLTAQEARHNINQLTGLMWDFQDVLKFSRTLGWGGQSLASLWIWRDPVTGRQRRAVLKNALGEGRARRLNRISLNSERIILRVSNFLQCHRGTSVPVGQLYNEKSLRLWLVPSTLSNDSKSPTLLVRNWRAILTTVPGSGWNGPEKATWMVLSVQSLRPYE